MGVVVGCLSGCPAESRVLTSAAPSSLFGSWMFLGPPFPRRSRIFYPHLLTSAPSCLRSRPGQAAFSWGWAWGRGPLHLTLVTSLLPAFRQGRNRGPKKVGTPGSFSVLTVQTHPWVVTPSPRLQEEGLISPSPSALHSYPSSSLLSS